MEWSDYEQRGKGNPHEDTCIKDSEDCGIIEAMKTVENKALMRIYRKDLTMPVRKNLTNGLNSNSRDGTMKLYSSEFYI